MEELSSEPLEEGEIVDDDDFEDISDNSIIDLTFGKFVSSNENLRALSLSSDSDSEIDKNVKQKKLLPRRRCIRHQKKRKRHKTPSDSSDSDISTCSDLKDKLKEAVHINGTDEGEKKPLEKRLKAMRGLTSNTNTETPEPPLDAADDSNSDKIDDRELEKLRIEALKTAVWNKFQRRKRKKAFMEEQKEEPLKTLENKENDTPKMDNNPANEKGDAKSAPLDLEEDEDVLRASLLAGLAKKITKVQTNEETVQIKPNIPALPTQVVPMLPKLPVNTTFKKQIMQNRPKPQVKPLIINVNGDSDTEEEQKSKPEPLSKVSDLNIISNSVEKFLKEQRAKFETETKKRFQIVHKGQNKSILEKSAVKLLPKSQQIEYQQLLKKLKLAEKRRRAKKIALQKAQNNALPVKTTCENQHPVSVEIIHKPSQSSGGSEISSKAAPAEKSANLCVAESETRVNQSFQESEGQVAIQPIAEGKSSAENEDDKTQSGKEKKKPGITSELTILQKTLKEIKMQRNGSLQIKSKYQVLTPIIRKITSTSNERKKQEQRIKHLLQELSEARSNLAKSHEKFSALVRELVDTKGKIDNSSEDVKMSNAKNQNNSFLNRSKAKDVEFEKRTDIERKNGSVPVTSTPIRPKVTPPVMEEPMVITPSVSNEDEDMDVCNSDETDMCQIDIVDPNDIDQIFTRKSIGKLSIPEYVSPLNLNAYERYRHVDPHGIMCPYEVNGSCRDIDCTFKHYLKTSVKLK